MTVLIAPLQALDFCPSQERICYGGALAPRIPIAIMVIRLRPNLLLYFTVILVALKVAEVIDWSWGWVLAPLWLPVAVVVGIAVVGFLFAATLLARLKKSFGLQTPPQREEIVISDDEKPVPPDAGSPRRIGNVYDHE